MRIVFMGTPDFAVPALLSLHEAGHEIALAVSQPDKPKGRHGALSAPPVKEAAQKLGIPVAQPQKASDPSFIEEIRKIAPDVIVVAAYGKILKQALLDIPRYGCINIHASLLPRWRGAAPIQWAVIAGDRTAGVTTMQMNAGLDTGDMLLKKEIELSSDETGGSLFEKLAALSGPLITETLRLLEHGELKPEKQPEAGAVYAPMLHKEMSFLDWTRPAEELERLIRGLSPWPGACGVLAGKTLKIHRAALCTEDEARAAAGEAAVRAEGRPGSLIADEKGGSLFVSCGSGFLSLLEVQLEGKKRMSSADFMRGAGELLKNSPRFLERSEKKA